MFSCVSKNKIKEKEKNNKYWLSCFAKLWQQSSVHDFPLSSFPCNHIPHTLQKSPISTLSFIHTLLVLCFLGACPMCYYISMLLFTRTALAFSLTIYFLWCCQIYCPFYLFSPLYLYIGTFPLTIFIMSDKDLEW